MAGIKINQYPLERLTFGDDDYYDIDYWNGSAFETAKIKGSVIKTAIQAGISSANIMDTDSLVLAGDFTHDLNENNLVLDDGSFRITNGSLGVLGAFNATHDGATGQDISTFISSNGNPVLIIHNTNEAVAIGTTAPHGGAILDITSDSKALLIPRLTTTQRDNITTPIESMLIYNSTTNQFEFRTSGGTWSALGGGGGSSIYTADGIVSADRIVDLDNNKLTFDLGDSTTDGIVYDGSNTVEANNPIFQFKGIGTNNNLSIGSTGFIANTGITISSILNLRNSSDKGISITNITSSIFSTATQFKYEDRATLKTRIVNYTDFTRAETQFRNASDTLIHNLTIGGPFDCSFFQTGFAAGGFVVGSSSVLGSESISLQGHTIIKGGGTGTGTTLALFDNDSTPTKTWEWLDNGTMKGYNGAKIQDALFLPSVQEAANSATFTINADEQSDGVLTAMSASTTIAAPTGTPVQSQDLVFRFKDDGTARSLTWNAIFRAIGVTLPTTTVANKLTYVGCKYNSTDSKWDVIAVQQEA